MGREICTVVCLVLSGSLAGCLYAPATVEERHTAIDLVRQQNDDALRVGVATRQQVIARLGQPQRASVDQKEIGYSYDPVESRVGFICFGGPCVLTGYYPFTNRSHRELWLAFDERDVLARYACSPDDKLDWAGFCATAARP